MQTIIVRVGVVLLVSVAVLSSLAAAATTFPAGSYDSEGYTITFKIGLKNTGTFRYDKGEHLMRKIGFARYPFETNGGGR